MKLRLLALLVLSSVGCKAVLEYGPSYTVENDTDGFIYVAPVRTAGGSSYRKLYEGDKKTIPVYGIAPGKSVQIPEDAASGLALSAKDRFDRVLWVAWDLKDIRRAISSKQALPSSIDPLYLGRNQRGIKYIGRTWKPRKYSINSSPEAAVAKINSPNRPTIRIDVIRSLGQGYDNRIWDMSTQITEGDLTEHRGYMRDINKAMNAAVETLAAAEKRYKQQ